MICRRSHSEQQTVRNHGSPVPWTLRKALGRFLRSRSRFTNTILVDRDRVSKTWSKIRASTNTSHEHELMGASQDRLRRRYSEKRLDRMTNVKGKDATPSHPCERCQVLRN